MKKFFSLIAAMAVVISAMAADLNIYASGLKARGMDSNKIIKVDYVLNAPATAVEIHVLNADQSVALTVPLTDEASLTQGAHVADIDVSTLEVGEYAWEVKATAAGKEELVRVSDDSEKFIFYATRGVVVNNYPETDDFGTVYVSMNANGANDGGTQTSKTQQIGIFIYDALLNLKNTGNAGYKGGVTMGAGVPFRIQVAADGKLFMSGYNEKVHGVWVTDGKMQEDFQQVLPQASLVYGFDVDKTETGYSIYALEDITYNNACFGAFKRYDVTAIPHDAPGDTIASASQVVQGNNSDNVITDGRGGWFLSQYRSADTEALSIISHVNKDGIKDWNSATAALGLSNSNRGAMGMNKDKTLLGIANAKKATVFSVAWDETGLPLLTQLYSTPELGNAIDGIAFDYADNLYVVSSSTELLYIFAPAKAENTETTPAAASQKLKVLAEVIGVESVSLDKSTADMKVGEQLNLVASILPQDAADKSVVWSSSDETIATVDANGQVTALAAGEVTISVTTNNNQKTASCVITITNVEVESLAVNPSTLIIYKGETQLISTEITPSNATNKTVLWTSSNEEVVTVDAEGRITAVAPGEATVTATTEDGGITATVEVTVPVGAYPNIYAYGLQLVKDVAEPTVGFNLNAPATKVRVIAYDAEQKEYEVATAENLKAEYQTLAINTDNLPDGKYTWAVEAEAEPVAEDEPVQVRQYVTPMFVQSRGLAVDQNTNSPFFGNVYVASCGAKAAETDPERGLYMFSPKFEGGNLYMAGSWSESTASPMRVVVGHDDNFVYVSDFSDNETNVHYINPANPDEEKLIFGGINAGDGKFTTEDGTYIHGSIAGLYVKGTGEDRTLYTLDEDANPKNTLYRYKIGEMTELWEKRPSKVVLDPSALVQNAQVTVTLDKNENFWISQYRWSEIAATPCLVHYAKADDGYQVDFNSGETGILGGPNYSGAIAFDREQTMLVSSAGTAVRVCNIHWDENDVPSLELVSLQTLNTNFTEIHALAIDHAKNVYVAGKNNTVQMWALIKEENKCLTPAPDAMAFDVEEIHDAIENLQSIENTRRGVYTVTGQYLGESIESLQLPQGVYIVNGKKVVK